MKIKWWQRNLNMMKSVLTKLIISPKHLTLAFKLILILSVLTILYKSHGESRSNLSHGESNSKGEDPSLRSDDCDYYNTSNRKLKFKLDASKRHSHHPSMFHIVIEPTIVCQTDEQKKPVDILAYVFMRMDDFKIRQIVRKTWANRAEFPSVYAFFVIGSRAQANKTLDTLIQRESRLFGDILQGSFIDHYNNLTFKSLITYERLERFYENFTCIFGVRKCT